MTRKFAYFSLGFALFHFVLETYAHRNGDSFLPMLFVDYIGISLLLLGSYLHLRSDWHLGVLCGGWGFEACLIYRAYFSRIARTLEAGNEVAYSSTEMVVLGCLLVLIFLSFVVSISLCSPAKRTG